MTLRRTLLDAVIKQHEADLLKAKANLEIFLINSAGVGEHSDIVGEMKMLVMQIHDASGCLSVARGLNGLEEPTEKLLVEREEII